LFQHSFCYFELFIYVCRNVLLLQTPHFLFYLANFVCLNDASFFSIVFPKFAIRSVLPTSDSPMVHTCLNNHRLSLSLSLSLSLALSFSASFLFQNFIQFVSHDAFTSFLFAHIVFLNFASIVSADLMTIVIGTICCFFVRWHVLTVISFIAIALVSLVSKNKIFVKL
jgi:hypothetical protein